MTEPEKLIKHLRGAIVRSWASYSSCMNRGKTEDAREIHAQIHNMEAKIRSIELRKDAPNEQ